MVLCFTICVEVAPLNDRCTIQRTCNSIAWCQSTYFAIAATYTHIEQGAIVFSLCDNICSADMLLVILSNNLLFGRIIYEIFFLSLWNILLVREELLYQVYTCKQTFPSITCTYVRHACYAGSIYKVRSTCISTSLNTILTDREDDFLHCFWVFVIIAHEQLLVTAVAILCFTAKIIFLAIDNLVAIIDSLLVILHLTIGINGRVKSQTSMECVCCTTVCTSEILTIIISAHLSHQRLNGGQLIIQPLVEILAALLGRELVVESILEWSLAIKIKEIIVVQGTEEANLCNFVIFQFASLLCDKLVVQGDVENQTLVCPVYTSIILGPVHVGNRSNGFIVLVCPQSFVCHQLL